MFLNCSYVKSDFFCKYLRSYMLYIVSKIFCWEHFKNKAMTASVYGPTQ